MSDKNTKTEVVELPIESIEPNPWNPNTMSVDVFNALVENIKEIGMVEPIMVVPKEGEQNKYVVISGEHRWEACKVLDYKTVPSIIRDKFDEDMQKFQTVRMNVLKGKMDPIKFTQLFDDMAEKYGEEMTKEMMKFVDDKAFKEVYMEVRRELPKDMQDKLDSSRKEIKTVDDLSRILNELFSKYGNTLDQNFMIFTYGGKVHLWVLMTQEFKDVLVDQMIEDFKEHDINASRFFEILVLKYGEQTIKEMLEADDGIITGNLVDPDNAEFN
jgi:ParB/RepB/Spo0J family partition protein